MNNLLGMVHSKVTDIFKKSDQTIVWQRESLSVSGHHLDIDALAWNCCHLQPRFQRSCSKQSKSLCASQLRKDHSPIASRVFSVPLAVQHYVLLTLISLARIRPQVSLIKEQWRVTRSILSANSVNPKPLRIIADMTERVFYHHIQFHFFHLVFSGDHATLCFIFSWQISPFFLPFYRVLEK